VTTNQTVRWVLKPVLFLGALGPLVWIGWEVLTGNLSADPLKEVTEATGVWTLRFLCATLAVTPLRRLSGWNPAIRFRRMIGLYAFFYGTVHFVLIYLVADRAARLDYSGGIVTWKTARDLATSVGADLFERPFITMGFAAWVVMLPLALTSTAGMIRRLGGRRWQALHRLTYVAMVAGVVHYWWSLKSDIRRPLAYAVVAGVLLAFRLVPAVRARMGRPPQRVRVRG
jgi:sulfoxide reductase heme-binding subunit YedZ